MSCTEFSYSSKEDQKLIIKGVLLGINSMIFREEMILKEKIDYSKQPQIAISYSIRKKLIGDMTRQIWSHFNRFESA